MDKGPYIGECGKSGNLAGVEFLVYYSTVLPRSYTKNTSNLLGFVENLSLRPLSRRLLRAAFPGTDRVAPARFRNRFRAGCGAGRERIHGIELGDAVRRGRGRVGLGPNYITRPDRRSISPDGR